MPAKVRFAINGVRELAKNRVDESSLRAVADEIGMSNSGLHSFIRGGEPYSSVRKRLVAWFMRVRYPDSRPVPPAEVEAAASLLAAYLRQTSPAGREHRFMQISEQIAIEAQIEPQPDAVDHRYPTRKRQSKRPRPTE